MSIKKTLGGDRLGSGNKMKVELHNYERSTHDLGYVWRSSMAAGTLVPFISELALPGDTFDITLHFDARTHPTVGPLFGTFKAQLDVFSAPVRLYQAQLHNNKIGIGMHMSEVKLPLMKIFGNVAGAEAVGTDIDNAQINPSCILSYLGIRGVGAIDSSDNAPWRYFNAIPYLMYCETYKQYYANKQEGNPAQGAMIHTDPTPGTFTVSAAKANGTTLPLQTSPTVIPMVGGQTFEIDYTGTVVLDDILIYIANFQNPVSLQSLMLSRDDSQSGKVFVQYNNRFGAINVTGYGIQTGITPVTNVPRVKYFNLEDIDKMREYILTFSTSGSTPFVIQHDAVGLEPYASLLLPNTTSGSNTPNPAMKTQEGLLLKTYQSDLFNNWLQTDWIDGVDGITAITAIDTSGGSFTIDTLNLSKKVYDMLNRIAVSGGTYDDWLEAVYTHDSFTRAEMPVYHGGLIKEVVFDAVVSNSASTPSPDPTQPLGTLAGRGTLGPKHKGGQVRIKIDEPSWILGIVSLTPRIDYSQGNKWDTHLLTMDDFHKPALDEIGFQELIQEQMAWWTTTKTPNAQTFTHLSAGKQPAWINYMTNVNRCVGNFAVQEGTAGGAGEMFMTLNRRYQKGTGATLADLTTYIDPSHYNHIFAQTSLDAQNFWIQIAVDMIARRKMSAKVMPNL